MLAPVWLRARPHGPLVGFPGSEAAASGPAPQLLTASRPGVPLGSDLGDSNTEVKFVCLLAKSMSVCLVLFADMKTLMAQVNLLLSHRNTMFVPQKSARTKLLSVCFKSKKDPQLESQALSVFAVNSLQNNQWSVDVETHREGLDVRGSCGG